MRFFSSARALLPVTKSHVAEFHERGFVKVENFWNDEEIRAIRAALVHLKNIGRLANVATDHDGATHTDVPRNLQLCPLSPEHRLFRSLPFHPKVAQGLQSLLTDSEDESVCAYLSQTFWKPPRHGWGTGFHQDNAYFGVPNGHRGTAMWTPVHPATVENGTLRVAPGFNASTLEHRRDMTSDHHITCVDHLDLDKIELIEAEVGDVVFFDYNTPHATGSNDTDHPRAAVAYHFLRMNDFVERQFPLPEDAEYVTPVITGPQNTFGEVEYGERADTWGIDMNEILQMEEEVYRIAEKSGDVHRVVSQDRSMQS